MCVGGGGRERERKKGKEKNRKEKKRWGGRGKCTLGGIEGFGWLYCYMKGLEDLLGR